MSKISEDDIQKIRSRAKIEEIIGNYIPVIHAGKSLKAVCPFHDDHDPSLSISPDKQIFKCFVCGESGNVFTFVQKYCHLSYFEAVREVAKLVNYDLPADTKTEPVIVDSKYAGLYKLLNLVIKYSAYQLSNAANASVMQYLLKRGIDENQIQKFQFGYLPDNQLNVFLTKKGFSEQQIVQSGMAIVTDKGLQDVFVNRLMIPIHDPSGNPIGFTARTMGNDERKYINTAATPIYTKGDIVYNYHRSYEEIRRQHRVIIVEGPMDLMALERAGFLNTVATLGTAVTKEQLLQLKKVTREIIFYYDGDKPGQGANFKGSKLACANGFKVFVANNPTELDPDEIDRQLGANKNRDILKEPLRWLDFAKKYLLQLYPINNYTEKIRYANNMLECINLSGDKFERDYFRKDLKETTGLDSQQLGSLEVVPNKAVPVYAVDQNYHDPSLTYQKEILSQVLKSYNGLEVFKKELGYLDNDKCQKLMLYIADYYRNHNKILIADLLDYLPDQEMKDLVIYLSSTYMDTPRYDEKILREAIAAEQDKNAGVDDYKQSLSLPKDAK